jgi:hypothetical protein
MGWKDPRVLSPGCPEWPVVMDSSDCSAERYSQCDNSRTGGIALCQNVEPSADQLAPFPAKAAKILGHTQRGFLSINFTELPST